MINPQDVIYKGVENLIILKNTKNYAISCFKYFGKTTFGIRWHGEDGTVGTPSSRGKPTWFIIPKEIVKIDIKLDLLGETK